MYHLLSRLRVVRGGSHQGLASSTDRLIPFPLIVALFILLIHPPPAAATPPLTFGSNGQIRRDGEPVFPFGFYHVSWSAPPRGTPRLTEGLLSDIATMGSAHFSLVHVTVDSSPFAPLALARATMARMMLIGEPPTAWWSNGEAANVARDAIATSQSYRAIVGWNIGDDINWHDPKRGLPLSPEVLRARRAQVHGWAPNALTYASGVALDVGSRGKSRPLADYRDTADLLGFTSYTIGAGSGVPEEDALEQTFQNFGSVAAAFAGSNQPLIAIPQLFAFPRDPQPTTRELRNQIFAALIHGFDGVLGYPFYAQEESGEVLLPETNPQLLAGMQRIRDEVLRWERWWLRGERRIIDMREQRVHGAQWRFGGECLMVVVNTDRGREISIEHGIESAGITIEAGGVEVRSTRCGGS
jgi:hypothetical protein